MIRACSFAAVLTGAASAFAAPVVTAIFPASGPAGTQIAVSGTGLTGVSSVTFNGAAASYTVQNDNLIYAFSPGTATTGTISVTHPTTGSGASPTNFTPLATPTTASYSPTSGTRGAAVTLTGTNYLNVTHVQFNGVSTPFSVVSPTQINTAVPDGATTGAIRVVTLGGTASSTSFTVLGSAAPTVSAFTPTTGVGGTQVTITGTSFTGTTAAQFNGTNGTGLTVLSNTVLRANAPAAVTTGTVSVTNSAGTGTSAVSFTAVLPTTLTAVAPATGKLGTPVTLTGTNLGGATRVGLGDINAVFTVVSATQITTTVPPGAVTAAWRVTTPTGFASQPGFFTVTGAGAPTIVGFSPTSGASGTQVTVLGTNFTGTTGVRVSTSTAFFTAISDTELRASAPGASGQLQVTNSVGSATSTGSFALVPSATVTGFTPTTGTTGTVVTVAGTNLSGATAVSLGGVSQPYTVLSGTSLTFTVTASARTGSVRVSTPANTAFAPGTFTLTAAGPPTPTGFSPAAGGWFTQVTIDGANLNGVTAVQFAGSTSTLVSVSSDTRLFAYVPNGAVSGPITVYNALGVSSPVGTFTVVPPPALAGFSPAAGSLGASVVLTGANLTGASSVTFANTNASFILDSPTQITATVPSGAITGGVRVQTPGGSVTSTLAFTVTSSGVPAITGFSPSVATPFSTVAISGSNFTGADGVLFNGLPSTVQPGGTDNLLRASVPSGATSGPLTVTNASGWAISTQSLTVLLPPSLTSFVPATGAVGTAVSLTGTGLTGLTAVRFGSTSAPFTISGPTQVATAVPPGATKAQISISGPQGFAQTASDFVVTAGAAPTVTGLSPASGAATSLVTLTGTNFTGTTAVTINSQPVSFFFVEGDTQLVTQLAPGATSGPLTVTSPAGSGTSLGSFTVLPAPTLSGFSPAAGPLGTPVTLTGTNLGGATLVRFNGQGASFTVDSPTQLTATVPAAMTGTIQVTAPGGSATSAAQFMVQAAGAPTIGSFSPSAVSPLGTLTVAGTNFTDVTEVWIAGAPVGFRVSSDVSLTATVPANPAPGRITVASPLGFATSTATFTPLTAPAITGLSPTGGAAGAAVTVTGAGFTSVETVTFNNTPAVFTVASPTQLTAIVPAGATSGTIRVTTPASGASSTQLFTVTSSGSPVVSSFNPANGPSGTAVLVSGSGFVGTSVVRLGGNQVGFSAVSDTLLGFSVPTAASSGPVTVINSQGSTISASNFTVVPAPVIKSLSPFSGPPGAQVALQGTGFTGATSVAFGGVSAAFTVASDTQLSVTVPSGAVTSRISITTAGGTAFSASSFFVQGATPTLSSFTPTAGGVGAQVSISGAGFTGTNWVTIGGVAASGYSVLNDLVVVASVGSGTVSGPVRVATSAGAATSAASFTVVRPPVLSAMSPTSGTPAALVTLTGTGFIGATAVTFSGALATFTVVNDTQLTATVPVAAPSGPVEVITPGGAAVSTAIFRVLSAGAPTVSSFTPVSGGPGTIVTATGTNFGGTSFVSVNGTPASFAVQSDSQLSLSVPSSASAGPIRIVNSAGAVVSTGSFTLLPAPTIGSLSPAAGTSGSTVAIAGANLGTATQVIFFDVVSAPFAVAGGTELIATVPAGARSGTVRVVAPGGTASSPSGYLVLGVSAPTIASFSPTAGGPSTLVTVTGARLTGASAVRFNGLTAGFNLTSDTELTATVPAGVTTGPIAVTSSAGTGASSAAFTIVPVAQVSSFTPALGAAGTSVTIFGSLFTGATAVRFNGRDSGFTVNGPTQITTAVPLGASSGLLSVVTPIGTGNSSVAFSVLSFGVPTVASFSPATGAPGTDVAISGTNFTGAQQVTFNGAAAATVTVSADTGLVARVPAGATTGRIAVRNSLGTATSATDFSVTVPPGVTSFSPASGSSGTAVTVTGSGFTGATAVRFNAVSAIFTVASDSSLSTTVPAGTTTGPVSVTGPTGTGTSAGDFTISNPAAPTVAAVNPTFGPASGGTEVTVTGLGFANGATVHFGATSATGVAVADATTLVAISPSLPEGVVGIEVTNPNLQKGSLPNAYTYVVSGADGGAGGGTGGTGGGNQRKGCGCATAGPLELTSLGLGLLVLRRRRRISHRALGGRRGLPFALVVAACSSPDAHRGAGALEVLHTIGGQFQRVAPPGPNKEFADSRRPEKFFSRPWKATFEAGPNGELLAKPEPAPNRAEQLTASLPATAAGEFRVELSGTRGSDAGHAWVRERLVGATNSARAEVLNGRVVYAGAKRGVDRIYEVSVERLEEYLRLADASAASGLVYELETGPAITNVVVDESGFGLVALDAAGKPVLKAPQPTGIGARGEPVGGRLVAVRLSDHRYTIRVELAGSPSFPVLLDPGWVTTGALAIGRVGHTATLLPNGKVLVTGGLKFGGRIASAELYDHVSGTWSATGSLANGRDYHTATLLQNGKVLVAGGFGANYLASVELYDPAAGTWSATGAMPSARGGHTATLLPSGKVLVAGGYDFPVGELAGAVLYDPVAGTWSATGSLATARRLHTATPLLDGGVLVAGGYYAATGSLASVELYDAALGTWSATGSLATARASHTATLLQNGRVLVAGGSFFVAGGAAGNVLWSAEYYDPTAGTWSAAGSLTRVRNGHTATLVPSGNVLVVGGEYFAISEFYDPALATWSATGSLATVRSSHTATLLPDGNVLVAGGINSSTFGLASAELFRFGLTGEPCTLPAECVTGFCVDGVCCDTACGGGDNRDCQTCSKALGAVADGSCGPVSPGWICRNAAGPPLGAGPCDLAEVCTGTSAGCPPDALVASGTGCRPALGPCDVAETCTGQSPLCPAETFVDAGTACRPAAGSCDVPELCNGAASACPSDALVDAGADCRGSAGPCDVRETCTGASPQCPADALALATTVCRPAAARCDVAERCSGAETSCPPDSLSPDGMPCSGGVCSSGQCLPCGPANCNGCCDANGACRAGVIENSCGKLGTRCSSCAQGQSCQFSACTATGAGGGVGCGCSSGSDGAWLWLGSLAVGFVRQRRRTEAVVEAMKKLPTTIVARVV